MRLVPAEQKCSREHQQQHLETISLAVVGTNDDASSSLRKGCEEQLSSSGSSIVQVPLKYRAVEAAKGIRTAAMTLQLRQERVVRAEGEARVVVPHYGVLM